MEQLLNCFNLMQMTAIQVFSAKTHNLHLDVFKALALNGMALALYFTALFTYPRHQSQPVIIWFKYETLSAHQFCLQCFDAVGWAAGRASGL